MRVVVKAGWTVVRKVVAKAGMSDAKTAVMKAVTKADGTAYWLVGHSVVRMVENSVGKSAIEMVA